MPLKLMYITNNTEVAKIAERYGVSWIFVDLEILGKEKRQGHLDTVISKHNFEDIKKIKSVLTKADLLVRINPIHDKSKNEIDRVIEYGADVIMLPYFKSKDEVALFIDYVERRVKTCLLFETAEAVNQVDEILDIKGIDYIHIGLNDLHLSYNKKFMFELLVDGTVEKLCRKFRLKGIPYGFGGIARLGVGDIPAEYIIAEHYRLGSSMAILSRSFCDVDNIIDINTINQIFSKGIDDIRKYEDSLLLKSPDYFRQNHESVKRLVNLVLLSKSEG